jgi:hypothetical protein
MKTIAILGGAVLSLTFAQIAPSGAQGRASQWDLQIGAPPSLPLASPGFYQSGNECAPDRPEAAWDRNYKFLGYMCVRNPTTR